MSKAQGVSGYLTATKHVMIVCNCHHDNLAAVCQLMPGKRSPTVTELSPGCACCDIGVSLSGIFQLMVSQ